MEFSEKEIFNLGKKLSPVEKKEQAPAQQSSFELKTTHTQEALVEEFSKIKRKLNLRQIPHSPGVIIFSFPNGKFYVASSIDINNYVWQTTLCFFPWKETLIDRKFNNLPLSGGWSWIDRALSENNLHSYYDFHYKAYPTLHQNRKRDSIIVELIETDSNCLYNSPAQIERAKKRFS